ncbi:YitT family protein [Actinotalea sp. BY-33]|uniref:YitT family protein n=1 Tax=Actinotalea soli TaxID=2819234 RepID=A0A939LRX3_9CELL|nr:YitT family protein [Actinotalea soli]MBO1753426.1 YitT family protein [Actinotalea soli]
MSRTSPSAPRPPSVPEEGPGADERPVPGASRVPGASPSTGAEGAPAGPSGLSPLPHSWVEDVVATLLGTYLAALGVALLDAGGAVTGGTAGLSLLLGYAAGLPFWLLFLLVNLPFLALGTWKRGWAFGARTLVAIGLVGGGSELHGQMLDLASVPPLYGALTGSLLAGVGMLILFRHNASMGGFNTLALVVQDVWGIRAGYVQLGCDVVIILAALTVAPPGIVAASALGAALLNLVLIMNHRPGRYLGT